MAATYPTSIITYTTKQNKVDVVNASHVNSLQDEVIALQTYVGTNPHGSQPNVAARLNAMLNPSGYLINSAGVPQPTSPGMIFYDTADDVLKLIKSDKSVESIGGSLSNVVFTIPRALVSQTTTGFIYYKASWKKIAGYNTIRFTAYYAGAGGQTLNIESVIAGTTVASPAGTSGGDFLSWDHDISGLPDGTFYNFQVQAYMSALAGSFYGISGIGL